MSAVRFLRRSTIAAVISDGIGLHRVGVLSCGWRREVVKQMLVSYRLDVGFMGYEYVGIIVYHSFRDCMLLPMVIGCLVVSSCTPHRLRHAIHAILD